MIFIITGMIIWVLLVFATCKLITLTYSSSLLLNALVCLPSNRRGCTVIKACHVRVDSTLITTHAAFLFETLSVCCFFDKVKNTGEFTGIRRRMNFLSVNYVKTIQTISANMFDEHSLHSFELSEVMKEATREQTEWKESCSLSLCYGRCGIQEILKDSNEE